MPTKCRESRLWAWHNRNVNHNDLANKIGKDLKNNSKTEPNDFYISETIRIINRGDNY